MHPAPVSMDDRPWVRWALAVAIAAVLYSYQLTTPLLLAVGIPTGAANLAIKTVLAAVFAIVAIAGLDARHPIGTPGTFLMIFLALLGTRVVYDVVVRDILAIFQTPFYVLSYYFGLIVVPVGAMLLSLRLRDARQVHEACYWMLVTANMALIMYILLGGTVTAESLYAGRFQVEAVEQSTAILNPITVAIAGTCLAAVAVGRLLAVRTLSFGQQVIAVAMIVLGTSNMLTGGSRGPAVAYGLMLIAAVYVLIRGTFGLGGLWTRKAMWLYAIAAVVIVVFLIGTQTASIQTIDRLVDTLAARREGGYEARDFSRALALADFSDSPLIGSSYLTSGTFEFPHNVVLDVLMGTGLVGFIFFAVAAWWMMVGMMRLLHGHAGPYGVGLALAGICEMVMGLTSQTAWQSPDFWVAFTYMMIFGNVSPAAPDAVAGVAPHPGVAGIPASTISIGPS